MARACMYMRKRQTSETNMQAQGRR